MTMTMTMTMTTTTTTTSTFNEDGTQLAATANAYHQREDWDKSGHERLFDRARAQAEGHRASPSLRLVGGLAGRYRPRGGLGLGSGSTESRSNLMLGLSGRHWR